MSDKYKMYDPEAAYFITMTVVDWINVFKLNSNTLLIVESLKYCQQCKGLEIYGWCLMPNHLHMIARAAGQLTLPEILRDFKKFTSKAIIRHIKDQPGGDRNWMLSRFESHGKPLKRIERYKVWQDGNHAKIIYSTSIFHQKLDYIHRNPVKKKLVEHPEDYRYSSARNYAGLESLVDIVLGSRQLIIVK
jgi:REP element-mobilizing transposase RayT